MEHVRESAAHAVHASLGDIDKRDAVAMVTAELLENAIKHSSVQNEPVRYRMSADENGFAVRVSNGCTESDWENVDELRSTIEWIDSCEDARQAYLLRALSICHTDAYEEGNLGLVRVAYGGQCDLSCEFDSDTGRIEVTALFQQGTESGSPEAMQAGTESGSPEVKQAGTESGSPEASDRPKGVAIGRVTRRAGN